MLKRHQCCIDLKANVLRIGTTGTETAFLSESDLPECARLSTVSEEDVIQKSRKEAEDKDLQTALNNSRQGKCCQVLNYIGRKSRENLKKKNFLVTFNLFDFCN